jgi:hypothetical protein
MSETAKNASAKYVSLLKIVHKMHRPFVDDQQPVVFWLCASLPFFSGLSTLCPLPDVDFWIHCVFIMNGRPLNIIESDVANLAVPVERAIRCRFSARSRLKERNW